MARYPAIYARVSTADKEQRPEVQVEQLRAWLGAQDVGDPRIFVEAGVTGRHSTRPQLEALRDEVRRGRVSVVAVTRISRLMRNLVDFLNVLREIQVNDVRLMVKEEAVDTSTAWGRTFVQVQALFYEAQVEVQREQIKEGIEHSRVHGTKSGKPIGRPGLELDVERIAGELLERRHERGAIAAIADRHGCSRGWIYRHVVPLLDDAEREVAGEGSPLTSVLNAAG